jgi:hypothetical protein
VTLQRRLGRTFRGLRRTSNGSRRTRIMTASFVGGVVAGLVLWSVQIRRSRRDLFSPSPLKRLAALGYLGGQAGLENAHLLSEYIRWEQKPALRRRAELLLKRMQGHLS